MPRTHCTAIQLCEILTLYQSQGIVLNLCTLSDDALTEAKIYNNISEFQSY